MNNVVLKGKLGAGFNDDRYTLPKDGNEGDWLEKTATGAKWFSPLENDKFGKVWIRSNSTDSGSSNTIAYGNGTWVRTGGVKRKGFFYSFDGKEWAQSNITSGAADDVTFVNGMFFVENYYSLDGKRWAKNNLPEKRYSIAYGDGIWVAGSRYYGTGIYYSNDGKVWTKCDTAFTNAEPVYANGNWVAFGEQTQGLYHSTDGKTWTAWSPSWDVKSCFFNNLIYADGIWVAAGYDDKEGYIYYSYNGEAWMNSGTTTQRSVHVNYANGFYACDDTGVWRSSNGKLWNKIDAPFTVFYDVIYANDIWVATTNSGICYSIDGEEWVQSNISNDYCIHVYADRIWIAMDTDRDIGKGIYYSTDGKTWSISEGTPRCATSLVYANGILVVDSYDYEDDENPDRRGIYCSISKYASPQMVSAAYQSMTSMRSNLSESIDNEISAVKDSIVQADWNQNDPTAKDYVKNRPCYAVRTAHYKIVQTGTASSANISISNSNSIAIYDRAVDYQNDTKGNFQLIIMDSSTREIEYRGDLPFISDSGGTRKYGDGSRIQISKNVVDDHAYLGIIDSALVNSDYEYTLYIDDPELIYGTLDDGYIPSTIQRVGADVIIPSSTSGSTKKFKITVDDSGTISASEVT